MRTTTKVLQVDAELATLGTSRLVSHRPALSTQWSENEGKLLRHQESQLDQLRKDELMDIVHYLSNTESKRKLVEVTLKLNNNIFKV